VEYDGWLDELSQEFPNEEWLKPTDGNEETDFEPRIWHELYFEAFDALRYDRHYGAFGGQSPIKYTAISAYAHDHGIVGDDFGRFKRFIFALDRAFIRFETSKAKSSPEAGAE
jgi:hypothetical protein